MIRGKGIGLMSGTSLDGVDLCYAEFTETAVGWTSEILKAKTLPYPAKWQEKLAKATMLSAPELCELNSAYGFYLGNLCRDFVREELREKPDFIASHGHTIFHQPHKKYTLQIGDGRAIKQQTDIPVIYDFRSADILLGGNGAPLVPIGDRLLFGAYDACLNLGGFSNISFESNGRRVAFDICPVNFVLNRLSSQLGLTFDAEGQIARNHSVNETLLQQLNQLSFYKKQGPKSLGSEWVNQNVFPLLFGIPPEEALATFTRHAAEQIARVIRESHLHRVLVTGGGAYNNWLIVLIQNLTHAEICLPAKEIIDFKEALIFAFMGLLRLHNRNNFLASATGAPYDHCSGLVV